MSRCPCCMYRAQCAGRVLAHATTNTNTTRKQRHRAASPVAVRSPIQARITPRGARRDAYSPPMPPVFLHHQPPPSPCWQRRRLQLFCQRLRKGRQRSVERRRRSASLRPAVRRALSCRPSPQPQPVLRCGRPALHRPPLHRPAVRQPWRSSGSGTRGVTRHLLGLPRCARACVGMR